VDAARDRMLANFVGMMRLVSAGSEIPLTQRARYRWDAAKAIDWSVRAVDRLFEATGGRGIFLDNPVQRAWRDVHAMRAHVANNPEKVSTVFGRSEFDLPPLDIRF
jgi:3-hydroxy-9,10-secoandrosta-1,3,5(10)-triene-9,17-dione monooxygenase